MNEMHSDLSETYPSACLKFVRERSESESEGESAREMEGWSEVLVSRREG